MEWTLDSNIIRRPRLCPLDNGRHTSPANVDLGKLDILPLELLEMVLEQLDIQALTKFRRVNRQAMQAVDSIHAYRQIFTRSEPSSAFALVLPIHARISTANSKLPDAGPVDASEALIYLLTCRRVCAVCFAYKNEYIPIQKCDVLDGRGLYAQDLPTLPSMKMLPGHYTTGIIPSKQRLILYDITAATQMATARYGSLQAVASSTMPADLARYQRRAGTRAFFDRFSREPRHFMAVIRAPVFKGSDLEWRVHCKECKGRFDGLEYWKSQWAALMLDPEEFEKHVEKH
ncbi:hypothetical protein BJY01DRAFT_253783 [Aspergillus pseudoustus]|uniref:F-box domain-containing protein n=1 Tax=Aspergillus pseudoustus TaxID=1810923 RepID=A0ABR4IY68_9EURO